MNGRCMRACAWGRAMGRVFCVGYSCLLKQGAKAFVIPYSMRMRMEFCKQFLLGSLSSCYTDQ